MEILRITLRYDNHEYVLDEFIPKLDESSIDEENTARIKQMNELNKVSCIMIVVMSLELQKAL